MAAEEDTSYTKLPIEERCVHKVSQFYLNLFENFENIFDH